MTQFNEGKGYQGKRTTKTFAFEWLFYAPYYSPQEGIGRRL